MAEEKIFSTEYTIFQKKINKIMSEKPCKELIESLIELQLYKNAEKEDKAMASAACGNGIDTACDQAGWTGDTPLCAGHLSALAGVYL